MPSYGFFFRHVKNLKLHDVQISYMQEDFRPPFILDDVKGVILYDIQAQKNRDASYFILKNVSNVNIYKVENVKDTYIKTAEKKNL